MALPSPCPPQLICSRMGEKRMKSMWLLLFTPLAYPHSFPIFLHPGNWLKWLTCRTRSAIIGRSCNEFFFSYSGLHLMGRGGLRCYNWSSKKLLFFLPCSWYSFVIPCFPHAWWLIRSLLPQKPLSFPLSPWKTLSARLPSGRCRGKMRHLWGDVAVSHSDSGAECGSGCSDLWSGGLGPDGAEEAALQMDQSCSDVCFLHIQYSTLPTAQRNL